MSAAHSGDSRDYSILEINQLLDGLQKKMDERLPGNEFEAGYSDHAITSASWKLPNQKEDLLSAYEKLLETEGKKSLAAKLMPGIRLSTSDTGVASAKVSALLMGLQYPIHIGGSQRALCGWSPHPDILLTYDEAILWLHDTGMASAKLTALQPPLERIAV